jgi:division protein CdvB (Snf7/Vps24/ESCRT-III family)
MNLFGAAGKKAEEEASAKNICRAWSRKLKHSVRQLDKEIRQMEQQDQAATKELQRAAKDGQKKAAVTLAREIARHRKSKDRIVQARRQVNTIDKELEQKAVTMRMAEHLQNSATIMSAVRELVNVPQLAADVMEMSQEMEKFGLLEEAVEAALDDADPELEEAADEEVARVMSELGLEAADVLQAAPSVPTDALAVEEDDAISSRLSALKA